MFRLWSWWWFSRQSSLSFWFITIILFCFCRHISTGEAKMSKVLFSIFGEKEFETFLWGPIFFGNPLNYVSSYWLSIVTCKGNNFVWRVVEYVSGSEHQIGRKVMPMEMHLVHYKVGLINIITIIMPIIMIIMIVILSINKKWTYTVGRDWKLSINNHHIFHHMISTNNITAIIR